MAKSLQKLQAVEARISGKSIKEIAKELSVSVASVSTWCRHIRLTQKQLLVLKNRITDPYYGNKTDYLNRIKAKTDKMTESLKESGIKEVGTLSNREVFLLGIALYWGEGFKKDHQVGFATSDVRMAKFFIYWLSTCFSIKREDLILRVTLNQAYANRHTVIEQYWSDELKVPLTNFRRVTYQKTIWKKSYKHEDGYKGVIRIRVRKSMNFLRKIFGYIEGVVININF